MRNEVLYEKWNIGRGRETQRLSCECFGHATVFVIYLCLS